MAYQDLRERSTNAGARVVRIVLAAIVVSMGFSAYQAHQTLQKKQALIAEARQQLKGLEAEESELLQWLDDMKNNPEFQKIELRQSYPAISPNEIIFAVPGK